MASFYVLCMITVSVAFHRMSPDGPGSTRLFVRKTPKQYMEQKNRKIKRRNEDRLLRLKKQRVLEKSAPYATFPTNSTVALSDDEELSARAICNKQVSGMMDASFSVRNINVDYAKNIEILHKAAIINDRRHRKSFLQDSSKEEGACKDTNQQRRVSKNDHMESKKDATSSLSSSSSLPSSPPLTVSSDEQVSSSTSSVASKLRKKNTHGGSRAARRSKICGKGGEMIKGGKSSLKDGFKAPEFKRLPDMENKMRYHSSFPLRNTG